MDKINKNMLDSREFENRPLVELSEAELRTYIMCLQEQRSALMYTRYVVDKDEQMPFCTGCGTHVISTCDVECPYRLLADIVRHDSPLDRWGLLKQTEATD